MHWTSRSCVKAGELDLAVLYESKIVSISCVFAIENFQLKFSMFVLGIGINTLHEP